MHALERTLFVVLLVGGLLPVAFVLLRRAHTRLLAVVIIAFAGVAVGSGVRWDNGLSAVLPTQVEKGGMLPSSACASCHPREYATWYNSYHRTMTLPATPETMRARFDGSIISNYGVQTRVHREGDAYYMTDLIPTPKGVAKAQRRVVMTTGSHYEQVFWTAEPGGWLRQLPFVYLLKDERWVPTEASFLHPPGTVQADNVWNLNCVRCHSAGAVPSYDGVAHEFDTEVTELGIACAACHGAAESHVAEHTNPLSRHKARLSDAPDATIVNPIRLSAERSAAVCGQCHQAPGQLNDYFAPGNGQTFRAGDRLEDHFVVDRYAKDSVYVNSYWPDGTVRIGGREYTGMIASGCYTKGGVTCTNCHAMHAKDPHDQLTDDRLSDAPCIKCHAELAQTPDEIAAHTHHAADSEGSRCYSCHMEFSSYALLGTARSHRIQSPTPSGDATSHRPNACNLCHLDKTLEWTGRHLAQWYGGREPELRPVHKETAASVVWLRSGDAAQRAVSAWHMGQPWARSTSSGDWVVPHLIDRLMDPYMAVRYIAHKSLRGIDGYGDIAYDYVASEPERQRSRSEYLTRWAKRGAVDLPKGVALDNLGRPSAGAHALDQAMDQTQVWMSE